jgi:pimeloyl-ACP methyl ester carboxylesterase
MDSLFIPGWGAPASLYAPLLPPGWTALEPPSFATSAGALDAYRTWLGGELFARGRSVVGGHSMGGALALLAAAADPGLIERLVLVSPAGLPLTKPLRESAADFARQLARGIYPLRTAVRGAAALARAPRAALRLAEEIRSLDLRRECARVRSHGVPALVVGCKTDTLVRCESARSLAHALGADYVELQTAGGHMWMLNERVRFGALLKA